MRTTELQAISVFSKDLSLKLTINQLSKELNKSYGFTNKYIRDYIDEGILHKKIVGSAILCSLNFSNEKTLGILMMNSIEEKMAYLKTIDKKTLETLDQLKQTPTIKTLFVTEGQYNLICDDKNIAKFYISQNISSLNIKQSQIIIMDKNEFKLQLKNLRLPKTIIIEGYEQFWRMISEMMS